MLAWWWNEPLYSFKALLNPVLLWSGQAFLQNNAWSMVMSCCFWLHLHGRCYNLPKSNVLHFSYMSPVHFSFYSKHFSETLSDACGGKCSVQFRQEHHSLFVLTGRSKDSSTSSSPTPFHSASTSQCCYIYYWAEFKICLCYIKTSCKNESIIIIE